MGNILDKKEQVGLNTHYHVECYRDGKLIWEDGFDNLVVTTGLNALISNTFKTIPGAVDWYVGLKGTGSVNAADTPASHAGWSELTIYSNSNRPTFTPGTVAAGSVDNSASKAVFNINGTGTVFGCALFSNNTKGGTTGTLYGAGDFTSSRAVESGDTLNVTVTLSATSS